MLIIKGGNISQLATGNVRPRPANPSLSPHEMMSGERVQRWPRAQGCPTLLKPFVFLLLVANYNWLPPLNVSPNRPAFPVCNVLSYSIRQLLWEIQKLAACGTFARLPFWNFTRFLDLNVLVDVCTWFEARLTDSMKNVPLFYTRCWSLCPFIKISSSWRCTTFLGL